MKIGDTVRYSLAWKRDLCRVGINGCSFVRHGKHMHMDGVIAGYTYSSAHNVWSVRWPDGMTDNYHEDNLTLVKSL